MTFPAGTSDSPETVWHYTNIHGLDGILSDQYIRASNVGDLNDTSEVQYGLEVFEELLSREILSLDEVSPISSETIRRSLTSLREGSVTVPVYVASASDGQDVLNQWQHYGSHGFAIGLSTEFVMQAQLEASGYEGPPGGNKQSAAWVRVSYERNEQVELAVKAIQQMHTYIAGMTAAVGRTRANLHIDVAETPEKQAHRVEHYERMCLTEMVSAAALMKDPVFYSEQEWRLVFQDEIRFQGKEVVSATLATHQHVGADAKLRNHVPAQGLFEALPIRAVRCGPNGGELNIDMENRVRILLKFRGCDEQSINVSTSDLPYRTRP